MWLRWPLRAAVFGLVIVQVAFALIDGPELPSQIDLLIVALLLGACVLGVVAAMLDSVTARLAVLEQALVDYRRRAADETTADLIPAVRVYQSAAVGRVPVMAGDPGVDPETLAAVTHLRQRLGRPG